MDLACGPIQKGGNFVEAKLNLKAKLATCALLASMAASSVAHATAQADYYNNYTFNSVYPVTNINILTENADSLSDTYSFTADTGENTITNGFAQTEPTLRTFLLGVATDLPGDPSGQQHLVVFANDAFAAKAQDIAFGTLFPNTDEDQLVAYLQGEYTPPDGSSLTFNFADGDAKSGPNGDLAFQPGAGFSEIAFSTGQIIGTGVSYESASPGGSPISAAPEPSTWLLMIAGIGGIGLMLRRAKTTMGFRFKDALSA